MTAFFVRTASARDLDAVRTLLSETWHATYDGIHGAERVNAITTEWHSMEALKARLERPRSEFLVADDGSRIGGMAFASADEEGSNVSLHQFYVHPDFHRRGIGLMLFAEIESCFPEAKLMRLEVEEANQRAIAFYRRVGFAPAGRTANCGGGQSGIPALIFEKPLIFD